MALLILLNCGSCFQMRLTGIPDNTSYQRSEKAMSYISLESTVFRM